VYKNPIIGYPKKDSIMQNRKFKLITQHPKPKELGTGVFGVDKKTSEAYFFEGEGSKESKQIATLQRTRIEFAAQNGIMLSGMELSNTSKSGESQYRFQEWWLVYE
jgi:hypothetical protein